MMKQIYLVSLTLLLCLTISCKMLGKVAAHETERHLEKIVDRQITKVVERELGCLMMKAAPWLITALASALGGSMAIRKSKDLKLWKKQNNSG